MHERFDAGLGREGCRPPQPRWLRRGSSRPQPGYTEPVVYQRLQLSRPEGRIAVRDNTLGVRGATTEAQRARAPTRMPLVRPLTATAPSSPASPPKATSRSPSPAPAMLPRRAGPGRRRVLVPVGSPEQERSDAQHRAGLGRRPLRLSPRPPVASRSALLAARLRSPRFAAAAGAGAGWTGRRGGRAAGAVPEACGCSAVLARVRWAGAVSRGGVGRDGWRLRRRVGLRPATPADAARTRRATREHRTLGRCEREPRLQVRHPPW